MVLGWCTDTDEGEADSQRLSIYSSEPRGADTLQRLLTSPCEVCHLVVQLQVLGNLNVFRHNLFDLIDSIIKSAFKLFKYSALKYLWLLCGNADKSPQTITDAVMRECVPDAVRQVGPSLKQSIFDSTNLLLHTHTIQLFAR